MTDQTRRNDEMIARYISAVEHRLPPKGAKDIVAELRQAIADRFEAREAELGRAPDRAEAAEILKSFGSPMLAAARYSGAQHLIGPEVYPYFWPTVRIVVGIVVAVAIIGFIVEGVVTENPLSALRGLGAAWSGALVAFSVVTVVFVIMDRTRAGAKIEQTWRPEHLPPSSRAKPKSVVESALGLSFEGAFIAWWTGLLQFPNMMPPSEPGIMLAFNAPAWAPAFWPVLVMAMLHAAIHVADLVHPHWSRMRAAGMIVVLLIGLASVWLLAQGQAMHGQLILVAGPQASAARVAELGDTFATISQIMLYGLAIGFGVALVVEGWRLARSLRGGEHNSPAMAGNGA